MRSGFTLIEVMAVVVLMALAAGLGVSALPRLVGERRDGAALVVLRTQGRLLRADALGTSGAVLRLDAGGWTATAAVERPGGRAAVPAGCRLRWFGADGREIDRLTIDRAGRSVDCEVECALGTRSQRWRWQGVTGEWSAVAAP